MLNIDFRSTPYIVLIYHPVLDDTSTKVNDYLYCRWKNGEAIISPRYNFTEFTLDNGGKSEMMYDQKTDPQENINVAHLKEYETTATKLRNELHRHIDAR